MLVWGEAVVHALLKHDRMDVNARNERGSTALTIASARVSTLIALSSTFTVMYTNVNDKRFRNSPQGFLRSFHCSEGSSFLTRKSFQFSEALVISILHIIIIQAIQMHEGVMQCVELDVVRRGILYA